MRAPRAFVLALSLGCILLTTAHAQRLDTMLFFPDSLGSISYPVQVLANPITNRVYVMNEHDEAVVFDPATMQKSRVFRGQLDRAVLCPGTGKLYLGGQNEPLRSVDAGADTLLRMVPLCAGVTLHGLAFSLQSRKLYAAVEGEDTNGIAVVDVAADSVVRWLLFDQEPWTIAWDSLHDRLYVTGSFDSTYTLVLDCATDSFIGSLQLARAPYFYAAKPSSPKLYCYAYPDTLYVIDTDSMAVAAVIPLQYRPDTLLYNPVYDRVYAVGSSGIAVIDANTDTVRKQFDPDMGTWGAAWSPVDGRVYLAASSDSVIAIIDSTDTIVGGIWLSHGSPQALGFSTGRGELYVGMDADYASAIDVPEDTLIGYVDYRDFYIRGLVHNPAGNEVYAMMTLVDEVKVIGPDYRTLAAIPVPITTGAFPLLNAALNRLYIADHDRLHVVDGNAHRLLRTLSLSDLDDPVVLLYPGTNRLYLFPIESGDAVYIYDCLADSVVAVVSVGDEMNCAAYQPLTNRFYCARYVSGDSVICVIDPVTNAVVGRLSAGPRGRRSRMFCHPENGRLYFCNRANNHLYIFDCRTNVLLDSFASVSYLDSLLWNREYNKLYICGRYQTVVLDCNTNTPVASLPYGLYRGGLMNERSGKLYLGRNVIDCRSDSLVATLTEVGTPYNFTWSPIDNRVFVSCRNSYIAVYQDEPVGIAEGDDLVLLRLAIASNPVRGQALLRCQVPPGQAVTLSVVDILGRVVLHSSFVIRTSSFPLDLRSMRAGVYFARLEAGSQRSIAKFVLQR